MSDGRSNGRPGPLFRHAIGWLAAALACPLCADPLALEHSTQRPLDAILEKAVCAIARFEIAIPTDPARLMLRPIYSLLPNLCWNMSGKWPFASQLCCNIEMLFVNCTPEPGLFVLFSKRLAGTRPLNWFWNVFIAIHLCCINCILFVFSSSSEHVRKMVLARLSIILEHD